MSNLDEWNDCEFLTCSVLPVHMACNCDCPFCFSKSSISSLRNRNSVISDESLNQYYQWARDNGASRLVVTGGGEPLLIPSEVLRLIDIGSRHFEEITCFTNGTYLTKQLARQLLDFGLTYLCYSRHHYDDVINNQIMGKTAPTLVSFVSAAEGLTIRAICVMTQGYIDSKEEVMRYIDEMKQYGVKQFTFKHTYTAYTESIFKGSDENTWTKMNKVEFDPFENQGAVISKLPWGPEIRNLNGHQVCYYYEPDPDWERRNKICRSSNLLSDGKVYASLENQQSLLYQLAV